MYENGTEKLNQIWRILNSGYMGSNYKSWELECDDDLYSATKIALHSLAEGIPPEEKYVLGDRSVDGNTVEDIQRRGERVLQVAVELYYEGINGTMIYQSPKMSIQEKENKIIENINDIEYYVQNYSITTNRELESYDISIQNFPEGTKILNSNYEEIINSKDKNIKIAVPTSEIKENIKGKIIIQNAYIKTNPIYYCESEIEEAQCYVTYTNPYEIASDNIELNINANESELLIKKVDEETNEPLSNVTFEVLDENKIKITEVITDENGEAKLENMLPQTVYIKESKSKEGYILSNEEKKVKLEYSKTSTVSFENEKQKGQIRIIKIDKDDKETKLEGVKFKLLDEKNNVLEELMTDKDGTALSKRYAIKDYLKLKIQEIQTLENYLLSDDIKIVELEADKTKDIIFENEKIKEPEPEQEQKQEPKHEIEQPEIEQPKLPRTGF